MFTDFLYLLRVYGMKTGLNEWNSMMEALQMNLNHSSLTEFYYMARTVLVKKETDYDKFDQAFSEYFKNLPDYGGVSDELLSWLDTVMPKTNPDRERADSIFAAFPAPFFFSIMATTNTITNAMRTRHAIPGMIKL